MNSFGEDHARLYADAQQSGVSAILGLIQEYGIACDLESAPAYTYTLDVGTVHKIEEEVELTQMLGLPASLVHTTDLSFPIKGAILYENQAHFHPTKYVAGLAKTIPGEGSHVFENSPVIAWEPTRIRTNSGSVTAKHVVMATHLPLGKVGGYYARAFPNAEPVIAAKISRPPRGMYVNVENPSYSLRTHTNIKGEVYAIVAGSTFKPGDTVEERKNFQDIELWLNQHFEAQATEYHWVNEDYTSMDNAPFVGWSSSLGEDYLIATGFAGWGISNGTAAAIMIADLASGTENPWLKLFDAKRIKPITGGPKLLKETAGVAANLIGGYLSKKPPSAEELSPGEAAILKIDGHNIAAYRDQSGKLHTLSAVCSHLGCLVGWNEADRTWDCPCHGSRFSLDGGVIHGPAVAPLEKKLSK